LISYQADAWLPYIAAKLKPKSYKQFDKAAQCTTCEMLTRIILPHVYNSYGALALAWSPKTSRDHDLADTWRQAFAAGLDMAPFYGDVSYFTHALRPVTAGHPTYTSPSVRVRLSGPSTFTFEFDSDDVLVFEAQCALMRSKTGKNSDSTMGQLHAALSQYTDYIGTNITWSGNKSFHYHISFDPEPIVAANPVLMGADPREGLMQHWDRLKNIVLPILNLRDPSGEMIQPDNATRAPEQYRRMPLGGREIGEFSKGNFFDMPLGTRTTQVVLWESYRKNALKGATAQFFRENLFTTAQGAERAAANKQKVASKVRAATGVMGAIYSPEQQGYFGKKLGEIFTAYPKFSHFTHQAGEWRAMFLNHDQDGNAASVMREGFGSVAVMGSNPLDLQSGKPHLGRTLGEAMAEWSDEYRRLMTPTRDGMPFDGDEDYDDPDMPVVDHVKIGIGHVTGPSDREQLFLKHAISRDTTFKETKRFFLDVLMTSTRIWVKGPEGSRKTITLMEILPRYLDLEAHNGRSRRAMFAFCDYVGAREKCEAFNELQAEKGTQYRGIVIKSFSKLYDEVVAELGLEKISVTEAGKRNHVSHWEAIRREQPAVVTRMAEIHDALYRTLKLGQCHVFFSVHDVAENWSTCPMSRKMWGRDFFRHLAQGFEDRDLEAIKDTHLSVLVHDEISFGQVLCTQPKAIVDWVRAMVHAEPRIWTGTKTSLADTLDSFDHYSLKNPPPSTSRDKYLPVDFNLAREVAHLGVDQWEELTLTADGAYPENNPNLPIYTRCVQDDHRWVVKPRMWWQGHGANTIIALTTEMLPTACIERADPNWWDVFALETQIARDVVDVYLASLNADNMLETCREFQTKICPATPDSVLVISDCLKDQISKCRTHISARGANSYIGKHVLQTMSFMHPDQHEVMLALNAYTGRNDCVALYHLDRFNQSAGRNLGFRLQGEASHTLAANRRLYKWLKDCQGWFFTRYDLVAHHDARHREYMRSEVAARQSDSRDPNTP
jgi:hypothetical protein